MKFWYTWASAFFAFALCTASASVAAQEGQIIVGAVTALSGVDATQGRGYVAGLQLVFDDVNRKGGIHGNRLTLVTKDDGGRPAKTIAETIALLSETPPIAMTGYIGNAGLDAVLKSGVLERAGVPVVGYRPSNIGTSSPLVYSVRAGMEHEIDRCIKHMSIIGLTRIAVLHEEGDDGEGLLKRARESIGRYQMKLMLASAYPEGSVRVTGSVDALLQADVQAILLLSSAGASASFIEQYRSGGGHALVFATSSSDIEQLGRRLSESQLQGVAIAQVTPNPYRITGRLVKEFQDMNVSGKLRQPASYSMIEGYIAAKVIIEAIRRQGGKPTRKGLQTTIEGISDLDLGGYVLSFSPTKRIGSQRVELTIVTSAGQIRQ